LSNMLDRLVILLRENKRDYDPVLLIELLSRLS